MAFGNETAAAKFAAREREELMTGQMYFNPELAVQLEIPRYVLYIYNVGPMSFAVEKGSAGPRGGYQIKACEKGKPFSEPVVIPSIVTETYMQENEIKTHSVTGEFMCRDIVHPFLACGDKLGTWSVGQNLDDFGVFWTRNSPPTEKELADAHRKMQSTFRAALSEASQLEATGQLILITPLMRYAADYYEEDRPWNKIYKKTAPCPGCLGPTKPGAAIHTCGAVLDWPLAISLGLKTRKEAAEAGVLLKEKDNPEPPQETGRPELVPPPVGKQKAKKRLKKDNDLAGATTPTRGTT